MPPASTPATWTGPGSAGTEVIQATHHR
jgi:hypothetical protein